MERIPGGVKISEYWGFYLLGVRAGGASSGG